MTTAKVVAAAEAATAAKVAAATAATADDDAYFNAIQSHVSRAIALSIDGVVKARSADPVGSLAESLATAAGSVGRKGTGDSRKLRDLQHTCKMLEDDNSTLKDCVDDLEQQVAGLKRELAAAKAKAKASKARGGSQDVVTAVGAFSLDDDDDDDDD
jgi:phage shock protein A